MWVRSMLMTTRVNDEIILSVGVKLLQILIVYRQTGHGYNGAVSRV